MSDFTLTSTATPQATIIKISGQLRLNCESLEFQLDRISLNHPKHVVLDLSELSFISSLGMGALVSLNRTVHRQGGTLKMANIQPNVDGGFRFTRLTDLIPSFPTVEAALASLPA